MGTSVGRKKVLKRKRDTSKGQLTMYSSSGKNMVAAVSSKETSLISNVGTENKLNTISLKSVFHKRSYEV